MIGNLKVGLVLSASLVAAVSSAAVTVYDNFGSGNSFSNSSGWDTTGPGLFTGAISFGFDFQPSQSGFLQQVDLAIGHFSDFGGANGPITVELREFKSLPAFPATGTPGNLLESWTIQGPVPEWNTTFTPQSVTSVLHPALNTGSTYTLIAKTDGTTWDRWLFNTTGDVGTGVRSGNNSTYGSVSGATKGAFRITSVPEPATALTLLGILPMLRRRRKA
jgi:hypothetical protein